ncbi:MAG: hypothetical protein ACKOUR_14620, partial [Planctomycetota bacterium]
MPAQLLTVLLLLPAQVAVDDAAPKTFPAKPPVMAADPLRRPAAAEAASREPVKREIVTELGQPVVAKPKSTGRGPGSSVGSFAAPVGTAPNNTAPQVSGGFGASGNPGSSFRSAESSARFGGGAEVVGRTSEGPQANGWMAPRTGQPANGLRAAEPVEPVDDPAADPRGSAVELTAPESR